MKNLTSAVIADRYKLECELARGGMGTVWLGRDEKLGRQVAVKVMAQELAKMSEPLQRFQREAMAVAQLRSTHVVQVYDYGVQDDLPYIVMELLDGESLGQRLKEAVARVVDRCVAVFGGVDILVNNAATNPHFGPILSSQDSHWDKTFDVNVKGYFRMVRACVPSMSERGGGRVINIASVAGRRVQPGMGVYCVSKAAVVMLTQVLAIELAEKKINVNALTPGFVKTKFSSAIWGNEAIGKAVIGAIPQKRMAMPEEIANMILFLASNESSFVTGSIIDIDGGQLAASGVGI